MINRNGIQTICRIQESIQQSYFFLDNDEYEEARKIFFVQYEHLAEYLGLEKLDQSDSMTDQNVGS